MLPLTTLVLGFSNLPEDTLPKSNCVTAGGGPDPTFAPFFPDLCVYGAGYLPDLAILQEDLGSASP